MEGHASRLNALEARVSNIETVTANMGGRPVWGDKYADNHRLRIDLEAAHAEILRLGGVIPEPCGPIVFRSACGAELEPVFAGEIVEVEYSGPEKASA